MSNLELEKAKALALGLAIEDEEKPNYAPSKEEMAQFKGGEVPERFEDSGLEPQEISLGESASAGAVKGVPFLKDALAIAERMNDGEKFSSAYESYKPNLDAMDEDIGNAEKANPVAFGAGEIGGMIGTTVTGAAALGATAAGGVLTGAGLSAASGVATGTLKGLSDSEQRGIADAAAGAAWGMAGEVGGHYIGKGLKRTGKWLKETSEDYLSTAVKKTLGIGGKLQKNIEFDQHLQRTGQKEAEFLENLSRQRMNDSSDELAEAVIDLRDAPDRMLSKIQAHKDTVGKQISKGYKVIDETHDIKINLADLKSDLKTKVTGKMVLSDNPARQQLGQQLNKYIDEVGIFDKGIKTEVTDEGSKKIVEQGMETSWNISRVHKLQVDIRDMIANVYKSNGTDITSAKQQQARVATALGNQMDTILDSVSSKADDVVGAVKANRVRFGNLSVAEAGVQREIYGEVPGGLVKELFGSGQLTTTVARAKLAHSVGGPGLLVGIPVLGNIANSPKTPLYVSKGLKKIGSIITAAPTGEISTRLTSAAMLSNAEFDKTLNGTIAEINLKGYPVKRTSEDVTERQEDIRNYIKMHQPESVNDFNNVIKNGSAAIGVFMDKISKLPGSEEVIEQGVGFDGRVYSEEDKATFEKQLRSSDVPAAQRLEMVRALKQEGKIPDFTTIVREEQQIHNPSAKKNHRY